MVEIVKKRLALHKKQILIVLILLSIVLNISGISYFILTQTIITSNQDLQALQAKYPLIATRVLQDLPIDIVVNFLGLRSDLQNETASWGDSFGMYFEYLPTGTSININGINEFHAASLFKTPIIMAYYHTRERLGITDDPILALTSNQLDSQFGNLWQKGAGYQLKASEAVRMALEESDNTAAKALVPLIGTVDFEAVYQGLDIALTVDKDGAVLTPKSYSSIFKALYFSAVLNKDDSQEILNYLAKSKFPDKLAAGVPPGVTVAHKIGDFVEKNGNGEAFTDCGIVYIPRRPYLLCMVSKTDEQTARVRMQDISRMIYDFVSSI
jgi:beta-lactamase class A